MVYQSPIWLPDHVKTRIQAPVHKAPMALRNKPHTISATTSIGMSDMARIGWQQAHLRNAMAHMFCYLHNQWVLAAVELIVQSATADQFSIETDKPKLREAMEIYLHNISPGETMDSLLRSIYRDLQINGNWYGHMKFVAKQPVAIHRIDFRQIVPDVPEEGGELESYAIFPRGGVGQPKLHIPADEILHLRLNNMGDNGTGLSYLECLDQTLALDRFAAEFQSGFFVNGVKAGDVYASDGAMSDEAYERDKEYLERNYTQPQSAFAPLFMMGNWHIVARGQDIRKDADFLKLQEWNREGILSVFSVPMSMMSTGKVGTLGSNGKQEDQEMFMSKVIAPLQKQVMEDLNRKLIVESLGIQDARLLPPGRPKFRYADLKAAELMTKCGVTGNEIRSALNLDLIEGMDEPLFLGTSTSIIGIPGDPDSMILTRNGPMLGAIIGTDAGVDPYSPDPLAVPQGDSDVAYDVPPRKPSRVVPKPSPNDPTTGQMVGAPTPSGGPSSPKNSSPPGHPPDNTPKRPPVPQPKRPYTPTPKPKRPKPSPRRSQGKA